MLVTLPTGGRPEVEMVRRLVHEEEERLHEESLGGRAARCSTACLGQAKRHLWSPLPHFVESNTLFSRQKIDKTFPRFRLYQHRSSKVNIGVTWGICTRRAGKLYSARSRLAGWLAGRPDVLGCIEAKFCK